MVNSFDEMFDEVVSDPSKRKKIEEGYKIQIASGKASQARSAFFMAGGVSAVLASGAVAVVGGISLFYGAYDASIATEPLVVGSAALSVVVAGLFVKGKEMAIEGYDDFKNMDFRIKGYEQLLKECQKERN